MGLMAKEEGNGGTFVQIEPGNYPAVCYAVYDLGTKDEEYQGVSRKRHKVMLSWEFPGELIESGKLEGQPYSISKFYTLSLGEKANLRHDLENWRGKAFTADELRGFDLQKLLGVPCLINVIHNDKGKAIVGAISPLPKGMNKPQAVNDKRFFTLEEWDQKAFEALSEKMQAIIMESDEYRYIKMVGDKFDTPAPNDDDRPFTDDDRIPF